MLESTASTTELTDAPKKPKGAAYWVQRIAVGIAGSVGTVSVIYFGKPLLLAVVLGLVAAWGAHEFYRAVARQGAEPVEPLGILTCILFQAAAVYPHARLLNQFLPVLLALITMATLLLQLRRNTTRPILNVSTTVLGAIYVGWLLSFFTRLRVMDHHSVFIGGPHVAGIGLGIGSHLAGAPIGAWLVIYVCAVTWMGDTMGLFVGYLLGRHKLAPEISPAKTREGAVGSVLGAGLFGWLFGAWLGIGAVNAITMGLLMGVFGLVGDLCESVLKRDLGLKDFGAVFANHGGVLDRIDSLLFTAPVVYYYILAFLSVK